MHAFLIVGKTELLSKEVDNIVKNLEARKIDFPIRKVADVRSLEKIVRFSQAKNIVIVSQFINESSPEAANALLKLLEEPKEGIYFVLTTKNVNSVLPTITSRCQIKYLQKEGSADGNQKLIQFISANNGERLKIINSIKKREEAEEFLEEVIEYCEQISYLNANGNGVNLATILKNADKTLQKIRANGNVSLQLSDFIVKLNSR